MGDNLKEKMINAVAWTTFDRFGQQIIQFLSGLVFARVLFPEDFGIMGIIMIFVAISLIVVESGFGHALIRKSDINNSYYTTVYYFNLSSAFLLYILLFTTAPLIAGFFHMPKLIELIRVMSLVVMINASYLIPYVQLSRALNFKLISKISVVSVIGGSGAGVIAAISGAGIWSLIILQSVNHLLKMILYNLAVNWKPTGSFQFSIIRELWKFSLNILFTSLLNVIFNNLFIIILGRSYSKAEAGQFSQGNKLSETFSYTFQAIFASSTFSLFSQLQNDIPRFGRVLGELTRRTALVTIPLVAILIAVATPLITLIWTEKFLPAVIYFQLMGIASILAPFYVMNINALNARGKSGKTMTIEIIKKAIIITGILLLYHEGIVTMLIAFVVGSLSGYPASAWFIRNELHQPFFRQLGNLIPGILTGIATGAVAAFTYQPSLPPEQTLVIQFTAAGIVYGLIIRFFFRSLFDKFQGFILSKAALLFKKRR